MKHHRYHIPLLYPHGRKTPILRSEMVPISQKLQGVIIGCQSLDGSLCARYTIYDTCGIFQPHHMILTLALTPYPEAW